MINYPLISVGLPVVKPDFLKDSITCALQQTYSNIEIVILNNAKDDKVRSQIENIVKSFDSKKIRYHVNNNQLPIIENWNKVLSYSIGEYFTILCDDDIWDESFLAEIYKLTLKHPFCNVLHSRAGVVDDSGKLIRLSPICYEFEDVFEFIYEKVANMRTHYLSDFVVKTEELRHIGGFVPISSGWGSDDLTWLKLAANGGIAYTPEVLFYYRESDVTISNTLSLKSKLNSLDEYVEILIELLNNINSNEKRKRLLSLIEGKTEQFKAIYKRIFWRTYFQSYLKSRVLSNLLYEIVKRIV